MRLGLMFKLTIPAVTLAIVGLGASTFFVYSKSRQAIETAAKEQLHQAADSLARNAQLWIESRTLEVRSWSTGNVYGKALEDGFLGKTARKAASKRLVQVKQDYPMYTGLSVSNLTGEVVAASDEQASSDGKTFSAQPAFDDAKNGGLGSVHAIAHPQSGQPVSVFFGAVHDKGKVVGVLTAVADLGSFRSDFVETLSFGESGQADLIREDGKVFLSSESVPPFEKTYGDTSILGAAADTDGGQALYEEHGFQHLGAYRHVDGLAWTALVSAEEDEVFAAAREARLLAGFASLLAALIVGAGVFLVVRHTLSPVFEAVGNLEDLSQGGGDLTRRLSVKTDDEAGDFARYFNLFVEKIQSVVQRVQTSTDQVAAASDEMAETARLTNASLEQQRSEIEVIASAVTEMSSTAQSVATIASEAASFAEQVDREAGNGSVVVDETIGAIDGLAAEVENSSQVVQALHTESQNIGAVLDVIKGVAEQTNLLALNAAIEAARAGDMGRGFAVVADEVRTLAQRTQNSTQEIEQIIQTLQGKAEQASQSINASHGQAQDTVKQARAAGVALQSITKAVQSITDMNHQIATAAEEQSAVTEEITQSVTNIHQETEKTAETSTQASRSSEGLKVSSNELKDVVAQFRV